MTYPTSRLDRAVDRAIADENARALADPAIFARCRENGDRHRLRLVAAGILPPILADEVRARDIVSRRYAFVISDPALLADAYAVIDRYTTEEA